MPSIAPLAASGSRELKRPRPIPAAVRDMIRLMVYGRPDDPDGKPLSFIDAGREVGIKPDVARRYLDRPDVRALLRSERRTFRDAICAGNEAALLRIRDKAANTMAQLGAVRVLEQLDDAEEERPGRRPMPSQPGLLIIISKEPTVAPAERPPLTIDVTPEPAPADPNPIFKHPYLDRGR